MRPRRRAGRGKGAGCCRLGCGRAGAGMCWRLCAAAGRAGVTCSERVAGATTKRDEANERGETATAGVYRTSYKYRVGWWWLSSHHVLVSTCAPWPSPCATGTSACATPRRAMRHCLPSTRGPACPPAPLPCRRARQRSSYPITFDPICLEEEPQKKSPGRYYYAPPHPAIQRTIPRYEIPPSSYPQGMIFSGPGKDRYRTLGQRREAMFQRPPPQRRLAIAASRPGTDMSWRAPETWRNQVRAKDYQEGAASRGVGNRGEN